MSSHNNHMVRAHGVNLRSTLLNAHSQFGDKIGLAVIDRYLFEVGALGGEIHGRQRVAMLMYAAADRLVREDDDAPLIDLPDEEAENETKSPEAIEAPARWSWLGELGPRNVVALALLMFFFGVVVGFST